MHEKASMLEAFIAIGLSEPFSSRSMQIIYYKLLTTVLALDYISCSSYSIN